MFFLYNINLTTIVQLHQFLTIRWSFPSQILNWIQQFVPLYIFTLGKWIEMKILNSRVADCYNAFPYRSVRNYRNLSTRLEYVIKSIPKQSLWLVKWFTVLNIDDDGCENYKVSCPLHIEEFYWEPHNFMYIRSNGEIEQKTEETKMHFSIFRLFSL